MRAIFSSPFCNLFLISLLLLLLLSDPSIGAPTRDENLIPEYFIGHAPGHRLPLLTSRLTQTLRSPSASSFAVSFPSALVTPLLPQSHPLTDAELVSLFKSLPPTKRALINLDPVYTHVNNFAFALPIPSNHPKIANVGVGERLFGIMAVTGKEEDGFMGGKHGLWVLGMAKAKGVEGLEEAIRDAWGGDMYEMGRGAIVSPHEVFSGVLG